MILIFTLAVFVVTLLVVPALSALSFYVAGYLADSDTNHYLQNFIIAFKILFIAGLIIGCATCFHINDEVFSLLIYIGAFCWMVCTLIDVLAITGVSQTIVFVGLSLLLNLLLYIALQYMISLASIELLPLLP